MMPFAPLGVGFLDRLATRLQERDLGELIDDVEEMARRGPEVFHRGMFVAGLVAAKGNRERIKEDATLGVPSFPTAR